jgi:hypothetical protein
MKMSNKSVAVLIAFLGCLMAVTAGAATITAVGADIPTSPSPLGTQGDWRTTTTIKPLDIDHDNVYGTTGYVAYQVSPVSPAVTPTGDIASLPSWLSVTNNGTTTQFAAGYSPMDNPTLTPGPSVTDMHSGIKYRQDATTGTLINLNFLAGTPQGTIRIGVFENAAMSSQYSYTISNSVNPLSNPLATQVIAAHENDTFIRYAFFVFLDVNPGTTYTIVGTIAPEHATLNNGLSGITVDFQAPEPTGMSVVAVGAVVAFARRRRRVA